MSRKTVSTPVTKGQIDALREAREKRERDSEEQLRRQIEGPCPRCAFGRLIVFRNAERIERIELVTDADDFHGDYPDATQTADRLIYCPNCGALHEVGGHTHYPKSGVVGIPGPVDGADIVELYPSWLRKIT
jgi:hypothetical protein